MFLRLWYLVPGAHLELPYGFLAVWALLHGLCSRSRVNGTCVAATSGLCRPCHFDPRGLLSLNIPHDCASIDEWGLRKVERQRGEALAEVSLVVECER